MPSVTVVGLAPATRLVSLLVLLYVRIGVRSSVSNVPLSTIIKNGGSFENLGDCAIDHLLRPKVLLLSPHIRILWLLVVDQHASTQVEHLLLALDLHGVLDMLQLLQLVPNFVLLNRQ